MAQLFPLHTKYEMLKSRGRFECSPATRAKGCDSRCTLLGCHGFAQAGPGSPRTYPCMAYT
eukprot:1710229-Pyramimonas_sp.AAC.1